MAEFAASIAGLITAADVVCRRTFKYIKTVREADAEVLELSNQVSLLFGTLQRLSLVLDEFEVDNDHLAISDKQIVACEQVLTKLREKLSKFDQIKQDRIFDKLKLKWPFSRTETINLRDDIATRIQDLSLALITDNFSLLLQITEQNERANEKLDQYVEAQHQIKLQEDRLRLLDSISSYDPSFAQHNNIQLHQKGTGVWFLEGQFREWSTSETDQLWVCAIPGAGKTVLASLAIASTIRTSRRGSAVLYFYCDYKDPTTQDPLSILTSLVRQLAVQDEGAFERLYGIGKSHLSIALCTELLHEMAMHFTSIALIVDGLDECGDNSANVTTLLARFGRQSSNVKSLFFSRDIPDIANQLPDYRREEVAAQSSDLRLYVAAEIEIRTKKHAVRPLHLKDASLKGLILDTLIHEAQGMFRWAALQIDYLCEQPTDTAIKQALTSLPPGIFDSYARLLHEVNKKPISIQHLVSRALKWIVWAGHHAHMTAAALCEAVSIDHNTVCHDSSDVPAEDVILRYCGSFIRRNAEDQFEVAHFTVREFLLSSHMDIPLLQPYKLEENKDIVYQACTMARFLCMGQFGTMCRSLEDYKSRSCSYPFRAYAVTQIVTSLRVVDLNEELNTIIRTFCDPSGHYLESWCHDLFWQHGTLIEPDRQAGLAMEVTHQAALLTPLHFTSLCGLAEVSQWLISIGANINAVSLWGTPLHLGLSSFSNVQYYFDEIDLFYHFRRTSYLPQGNTGDEALIKNIRLLIEAGADVKMPLVIRGSVPISMSLLVADLVEATGSIEHLHEFLSAGMDIQPDCTSKIRSDWGMSLLRDLLQMLKDRSYEAETEARLIDTIARFPDLVQQDDGSQALAKSADHVELQQQIFLMAIRTKNYPIVLQFLDEQSVKVGLKDDNDNGNPAIVIAARSDSLECCKILLDHNADVNEHGPVTEIIALQAGLSAHASLDLIAVLCNHGASMDHVDKNAMNNWHHAAFGATQDICHFLANRSKSPVAQLNAVDNRGNTPLHYAALINNVEVAKWFLTTGADVTISNNEGVTPLHVAAKAGAVDIARLLLERGADPRLLDKAGHSTLGYAFSKSNKDAAQIIETICQSDDSITDLQLFPNLSIAFHHFCRLERHGANASLLSVAEVIAKTQMRAEFLNALLVQHRWLMESPEEICKCLLILIETETETKHEDVLVQLVERLIYGLQRRVFDHGYKPNDGNGGDQATEADQEIESQPIEFPGSSFKPQVLDYQDLLLTLINDKLPVTVLNRCRGYRGEPILNTLLTDYPVLKRLIEGILNRGVSPDARIAKEINALESAIVSDMNIELVRILLQASKEARNPGRTDLSLIHYAAGWASTEHMELLHDFGFSYEARGKDGVTPLMLACEHGRTENVIFLLKHNTSTAPRTRAGIDSIGYAAWYGHLECMDLIAPRTEWKEKYYSLWTICQDRHVKFNGSISHMAVANNKHEILRVLLDQVDGFELADKTSDVSLLATAILWRRPRMVEFLLKRGIGESINKKHETELHLAVRYAKIDVVLLMIRHGFDVNRSDRDGDTPLLIAQRSRSDPDNEAIMAELSGFSSNMVLDTARAIEDRKESHESSDLLQRALQKRLGRAIEMNDRNEAERLLKQGAKANQCYTGLQPDDFLLFTLSNRQEELAWLLINNGAGFDAIVEDDLPEQGYTPLHYCAVHNLVDLGRAILHFRPHLLFEETEIHPIYMAIANGSIEFLRFMLVEHARIWDSISACFAKDGIDSTKTRWTRNMKVVPQNLSTIQMNGLSHIWKLAPTITYPSHYVEDSPLHFAAKLFSDEAIECLCDHGDVDVNYTLGDEYTTPLDHLLRQYHPQESTVAVLLRRGASTHWYTSSGEFVHSTLTEVFDTKTLARLNVQRMEFVIEPEYLELGFSYNAYNILSSVGNMNATQSLSYCNTVTQWRRQSFSCIFHLYLNNCHMTKVSHLISHHLNAGFDLSSYHPDFGSIIHYWWRSDQHSWLYRLLRRIGRTDSKRLLNSKPNQAPTLLYHAAAAGRVLITKVLLRYRTELDLDMHGGHHGSALMAAAYYGRGQTVKMLIHAGASITYKDPKGRVFSAITKAENFPEIVRWILVERWTHTKRITLSCHT